MSEYVMISYDLFKSDRHDEFKENLKSEGFEEPFPAKQHEKGVSTTLHAKIPAHVSDSYEWAEERINSAIQQTEDDDEQLQIDYVLMFGEKKPYRGKHSKTKENNFERVKYQLQD